MFKVLKKSAKSFICVLVIISLILMMTPIVNAETQGKSFSTARYSVLVLDTSGSMRNTPILRTKQAAVNFCKQIMVAEGDNYVAIVSLNTLGNIICDFTNDISTLNNKINSLNANGSTNHEDALAVADQLLEKVSVPGAIKNIVLMSDGLPENGNKSYNGPYTSSDYSNGYYYANAAYDKAHELKEKYYIYALGFFHSLSGNNLTFARRFMNDLQNAGYYEVTNPDELDFQFGKIAGNILKKTGQFKFAGMLVQTHDAEATYHYDDGYFLEDSTIYNNQLSTMSLCLELATWSSYDTSIWKHKSKNARELLTGEVLTAGGSYSKETEGIGFKDFAQNDYWNNRPTRNSIGVVAANKKITDVRDNNKEYTLIALAVRGGGYASEWASNFNTGNVGTHAGFTEARDNVLKFLKKYIEDYSITGDIKLWVVGYSRGGATANMVGGALNDEYVLPNVSLKQKDLFVYTFEAPQGALESNLAASHGDYSNIHNVVNLNDVVPLVAPQQWGFARYNYDNDYILPSSKLSDSVFNAKAEAMKKEYYSLEGARAVGYKVVEFSEKENLKIDRSKILPFGDPLFWWEESKVPQREILIDTIDFLVYDVMGSRTNYNNNFQSGVMEIFDVLNNGSGKMEKFMDEFSEQLTAKMILEILRPIFSINPFYKFEDRREDVKKNVSDFVIEVVDKADIDVSDLFINSLTDVVFNVFGQVINEVWNNNTDSVNLLIKLVDLVQSDSLAQGHYPEVCLAWLMSQDPNYNKNVSYTKVPSTTRIIYINCPVDVNVYDSNNTLVASIIDDVPQDVGSSIVCFINENGEKVIYLPANEDYRINIQATDDGEMSYSLREYNLLQGSVSRLLNYYNIPIIKGDTFTGVVDSFSDAEIETGALDGSSVEYKLLDSSSNEVSGREEISGADIGHNYFKVTVAADNDSGYVDGTGTFLKGNFAKVEAMPLSGSSFLGWYEDDELVSKDDVYRFPVKEDINLVAKFEHVEKYPLKLNANVGGKITSVDGYYTVGTKIAVVAEADDGYVFKNWTSSNGGIFEDENSATTTFTVPDNETTLTANFERIPGYYVLTVIAGEGGEVNTVVGSVYAEGETIDLEAIPDVGYRFKNWISSNGGAFANANEASTKFTIPANDTVVTANFELISSGKYNLSVIADEGGKVNTVVGSVYAEGETIKLEAIPDVGYRFKNWTSSNGGAFANANEASTKFTIPANDTVVTANFELISSGKYNLSVIAGKGGKVNTVVGSVYAEGETIKLEAIPFDGYRFRNWKSSNGGTFADANSLNTVFTMPANHTIITANFEYVERGDNSTGGGGKTTPTTPTTTTTSPTGVPWSAIIKQINNAKDGETITVNMKNETELPTDVLTALKGKNITLVLDMGKYTWSINSKNIRNVPSDKNNYNLKVSKIEDSSISKLANSKDIIILGVENKVNFPFTATLKWNVGIGQKSNRIYLSRYNEAKNQLEYLEELLTDNRDNVKFDFEGTYKYLFTIEAVGVFDLTTIEIPGAIQIPKDIRVAKEPNTKEGQGLFSFVPYRIENNKAVLIKWSSIVDNTVSFIAAKDGFYEYRDNKKVFNDINGHWAENAIIAITSRELFSGIGNGKFDPNGGMTRAMFATILSKLDEADLTEYKTSQFADVDIDSWFAASVAWAEDKGIMKGYGNGIFGPNELITREQMAVILNNYMNYKGITLPIIDSDSLFSDNDQISIWARVSVTKMKCLGLIKGVGNNNYAPKDIVNRASVAQILMNLINAVVGK